jgi:hypothetical protein
MVQMIFARRSARPTLDATGDESLAVPASFREDFPFFKFVPSEFFVGLIIVYGEL